MTDFYKKVDTVTKVYLSVRDRFIDYVSRSVGSALSMMNYHVAPVYKKFCYGLI